MELFSLKVEIELAREGAGQDPPGHGRVVLDWAVREGFVDRNVVMNPGPGLNLRHPGFSGLKMQSIVLDWIRL